MPASVVLYSADSITSAYSAFGASSSMRRAKNASEIAAQVSE